VKHAIEFVDRNEVDTALNRYGGGQVTHYHRWTARCLCGGWHGVPKRTKPELVAQFREHKASMEKLARTARSPRRRDAPLRRPLTPRDQLPEVLR
jgi:hypothetical protein